LSNISGDIKIVSWEGTQAEMVAVKTGPDDQLKVVDVAIDAQPSRLDVRTVYPKGGNNRVSVSYDLKVPRNVNLDSINSVSGNMIMADIDGRVVGRTVSGDVQVQRIGQGASLESVSGGVKATDVNGRVSMQSVSGSAVALNIKGDLTAKSVSGGVQINQAAGYIQAESVSGGVTINGGYGSGLKASSVSGEISFEGKLNSNGRYELKSHSGKVTIAVPGDSAFALQASTFSGSIQSDFDIKVRGLEGNKKTINGTVGSGGATVEASSFSGSVSIRKK
jgi:DUF4097 and DUF4098 domain-containing protein YvlB